MTSKTELGRIRGNELANVLKNSQDTRKQNFTSLAEGDGKNVKTYCALGAIGCEKNIVGYGYSKQKPQSRGFDINVLYEPPYSIIINAYGLDDKFTKEVVVPSYDNGKMKNGLGFESYTSLSAMIPELNDDAHWTFQEIGEFIECLADCGYLKACSAKKIKFTNRYLLEPIQED